MVFSFFFGTNLNFLAKRSTFAYSMPYIFGKLWHLTIIWAIRKAFQCILQGVRILLAKYTWISPTSENDSYIDIYRNSMQLCSFQFLPNNDNQWDGGLSNIGWNRQQSNWAECKGSTAFQRSLKLFAKQFICRIASLSLLLYSGVVEIIAPHNERKQFNTFLNFCKKQKSSE